MGPEPVLHTLLPWSELVGGEMVTLNEFRGLLRQYSRTTLLMACSRLVVLFNFGPDGRTVAEPGPAAYYIGRLFPTDLATRVQTFSNQGRAIFFQGQFRFLSAEILRLGSDEPDVPPEIDESELGRLLLIAGEMLYLPYRKRPGYLDEIANLIATFLPIYEISRIVDPAALFLRFYIFLTVNIPRLPDDKRQLFDVPAVFQEHFGFSIELYSEFVYCFFTHSKLLRDKVATEVGIPGGLSVSNFKYTNVAAADIEMMFKTLSFSLDSLKTPRQQHGYADFDFLKDYPYLRHECVLFCLDYEFAVNKLESATIWRVLRDLKPEKRKAEYLSFWGYVFEDYVAWLFERYASRSLNASFVSPRLVSHSQIEICDLVVICGRTAILIETKLATCPSVTKYSGNLEAMKEYLESKLVNDKGVGQLVNAIRSITGNAQSELPLCLRGIRKIIPLVVTKDDIGSSWKVNEYLNARFQEMRGRHKRYTVTPLLSMNVATLETLMGKLNSVSMEEILEDRIHNDPSLGRSFDTASSYVHPGMGRNLHAHMTVLQELSDRVVKDFEMGDPAE